MCKVNKTKTGRQTMRRKFILSLSSIAVVLLISCIISVIEYLSMSDYVSGMMARDIDHINVAGRLSDATNRYNLQMLAVIGDGTSSELPDFDDDGFRAYCDSLRSYIPMNGVPLADSVEASYSSYMQTALAFKEVYLIDTIDTRTWFFETLQPRYNDLHRNLDSLSKEIHANLSKNSKTFDRGFYRSLIPGIVAVGVGLLLVLMLMFFLLSDFAKPLSKMLDSLRAYRVYNQKYSCRYEGDEQLQELNDSIRELADENLQLRNRLFRRDESQGDI